jgi:hypothetical protein
LGDQGLQVGMALRVLSAKSEGGWWRCARLLVGLGLYVFVCVNGDVRSVGWIEKGGGAECAVRARGCDGRLCGVGSPHVSHRQLN